MKKNVLIFMLVILICGCSNKEKSQKISFLCEDTNTLVEVKEKDVLSCKLLGEDFNFKIIKVEDDKIELEANEYGLTSSNNLNEKNKKFTLSKNNTLRLATQTTDYQESVIFEWKE